MYLFPGKKVVAAFALPTYIGTHIWLNLPKIILYVRSAGVHRRADTPLAHTNLAKPMSPSTDVIAAHDAPELEDVCNTHDLQ